MLAIFETILPVFLLVVLGALLKWLSWVMEQNGQGLPPDADGEEPPFPASAVYTGENSDGEPLIDYVRPARRFDALDFLLGVKRG